MKRRLKLLAASLALSTFLPAIPTFAAEEPVPAKEVVAPTEEVSAPKEEVANPAEEVVEPKETAVEAETNVDYLNYLELEDFIISAERIPTNKWDTPANVTVITAKEIEDNHYQSIGEALRHVNGVVTNQLSMNGGKRVLVLVNGRRWIDPQIHQQDTKAYLGFPSMKIIERIEVVKGGNSALYGSDAFNGVVNIITKKGTKNETSIDLNMGSWRRHQYEITNQGVLDKFSWFVAGKLEKTHPSGYKRGYATDVWEAQSTAEESAHTLAIRLDQRFTERDSLTFDFMHISVSGRYYYPYLRRYVSNSDFSDVINNVSLTYNFKEGTSTPGWLRYINNYYSTINLGTKNPHARMQGIEYQNGWELGQHKIIAGLEWHKSTASDVLNGYKNVSMNTKSVYLQDTINMGDKWTVIPGVRYDHSSEFGNNWSPKLAANYRPDERTKFYATWGRSYNVPLLSELYSDIPDDLENFGRIIRSENPDFLIGDRKLLPEKGNSTIIGIEHDFDEKTGFTFSFFQNKMKHNIDWATDDPTKLNSGTIYYLTKVFNRLPLKSRGFELTFHQKINDHFSYDLGYSHTHTHLENPDSGDISYYRPQPNGYRLGLHYQNRGLKMNLLGTMASGINTNITTRWRGSTLRQAYPVRKYAVLDFNLSYSPNENATFYFKALNLTNQHYSNRESREFDDDGWKYVFPENGRSFIYGVNYRF